ncbi:MAG: hypothetical protein M1840_000964 [Geoglossum simile]|nr:MAG: hypothetical protein M1840_000964 [Geoglossum simile]
MQVLQLLGTLLSGATLASAAIGPIAVWWDAGCPQKAKDAFDEALEYATKGHSALDSTDQKYQDLYSWVFGSASKTKVREILSAITQTTTTATKVTTGSQLAIYCDGDARWVIAPDTIATGNSRRRTWPKAMYDEANDIVFDPKAVTEYKKASDVPKNAQQPGCLKKGTNAEVYQRFDRDTQKYTNFATLTICQVRLNQKNTKLKDKTDAGKELSSRNPSINTYALMAQTILHEMTHHILLGDTNDVSYKWKGVTGLASSPDALNNADSYGYFGLGAWLLDHVALQVNGKCYKKPATTPPSDTSSQNGS